MSRTSAAGSWGLVLAMGMTTSAMAGDEAPPPLLPPAEAPPILEAPAVSSPAPAPVRSPSSTRTTTNLLRPRTPVAARTPPPLVRPRAEANAIPPSSPPADAPPALDEPPALDGPSEMRAAPDRASGSLSPRRGVRAGSPLPDAPPSLELEPAQDGDPQPLPDPASRPGRDRTGDGDGDGETVRPKAPEGPSRPSKPSRRFGLFPAPRPRPAANDDATIRVEPRSDPAADAALKRRLEAKVKEAVGDRARDIEVRVVDRNVVVRARVDRFWNRRNVRRAIEALPALSGYRSRVEIED